MRLFIVDLSQDGVPAASSIPGAVWFFVPIAKELTKSDFTLYKESGNYD